MNNVENLISQLENQRSAIDRALMALREATGSSPSARAESLNGNGRRRKRRLSPEGRKRIIEATKKRWAAVRAKGTATLSKSTAARRGVMSPQGRKRLALAMKKRWVAAKKAGQTKLA